MRMATMIINVTFDINIQHKLIQHKFIFCFTLNKVCRWQILITTTIPYFNTSHSNTERS